LLVIRDEQMLLLSRSLLLRFDQEAFEHVQKYFPELCASLGKDETMEWVRDGLKRARSFGFETRSDLLRYLNLLFEFGREFELSEANEWARPYLVPSDDWLPSNRMNRLMEEAFRRLNPPPPPAPPAEVEPDDDEAYQFDGIVWGNCGVDPNYVPQSIKPVYRPIDEPGDPDDDNDDDDQDEADLEEDEEDDGGR
jgi:hypothetical protein